MKSIIIIVLCCIFSIRSQLTNHVGSSITADNPVWPRSNVAPSVFVVLLVRNKAHTLPWSLYYFDRLDYPKQRMRLWIRCDHNEDNSAEIIQQWLNHVRDLYDDVDFLDDSTEKNYSDAKGPFDWSPMHVQNVIRLKQEALNAARKAWADFVLFVDADNFLVNDQVLKELILEDRNIISPMLNATASEHYSNFWGGMDDDGYYRRTENYMPIRSREIQGVFDVAMVHSTMLIQLRNPATRHLAYDPPPPNYSGPIDDIIIFAHSAKHHGIQMHITNRNFYGFMLVPMEDHNTIEEEREQFIHLKLENIVFDTPLEKLSYIRVLERQPSKLGFDEIYMINLERRPDRREKMLACFRELGINATIVKAVDGKLVNDSYLTSLSVQMMPGYADPYHGRALTMGEIGCFLSHYFVWLDVLTHRHSKIIIFEDDVRFRPYFPQKLRYIMYEIETLKLEWDLVYLGRKRLKIDEEADVEGSQMLIWPEYSYWTLGYMLSYTGASKLIKQNPLSKMIPVDEYLPIMFDKHPDDKWKENFHPRNLISMSSAPLLIEPTHYTGEPGYITDTEDSQVLDDETLDKLKGDSGVMNDPSLQRSYVGEL